MVKFNWEKKGLIFKPSSDHPWIKSHAQCPFTLIFDNFVRVFFSTRGNGDENNQFVSQTGYVDLDRNDLTNIIDVSSEPIIALGERGCFDEFGSMAGSIIEHNEQYYLYYCGWQRSVSTPYNWQIGLGIGDGKSFERYSSGPIIGSHFNEPYLQACPIVYKLFGDEWHMFYLSGVKWIENDARMESQYLIMHATSSDGIYWHRNGKPIIPSRVKDECQTSPSIFEKDGTYHMIFSYRHGEDFRENYGKGYRIGYAHSKDFINWERNDALAGIDLSNDDFDDKMIAYPHIFKLDGKTHLFYCGNNFGKEGFGWATLND